MKFGTYLISLACAIGFIYWALNSEWIYQRWANVAARRCLGDGFKKAIVFRDGLGFRYACAEKIEIKVPKKELP